MTTLRHARLLPLAIAGLLLAGCAAHRETVAETDEAAAVAPREAVAMLAAPPPSPPAPPASAGLAAPPADAGASATLDRVMVSGERARGRVDAKAVAISKPEREEPRQQAQSGTLTAGDYDDLLNPSQYARYAERYLQDRAQPGLPFVDTRTPLKVRVVGKDGQPVAFADVSTTDSHGRALHLPTTANGTAVFFPSLDGLAGRVRLEVATKGTATIERSVDLNRLGRERTITIPLPIAGRAPEALDLVLAIDTTGSMTDELRYLQVELDSIVASLRRIRPGTDIRVGLVVYRDEGDEYVTRRCELTGDLASLRRQLGDKPFKPGARLDLGGRPVAVGEFQRGGLQA